MIARCLCGEEPEAGDQPGRYLIRCGACRAQTPRCTTMDEAIRRWNAMQEAEMNPTYERQTNERLQDMAARLRPLVDAAILDVEHAVRSGRMTREQGESEIRALRGQG